MSEKQVMTAADLITEKELQATVVEMAILNDWLVYHQIDMGGFRLVPEKEPQTYDEAVALIKKEKERGVGRYYSKRIGSGFPDLVLVRGVTLLYREVKTEKGVLSADQQTWGDRLLSAGANWAVWKPSDLPLIEATLRDATISLR